MESKTAKYGKPQSSVQQVTQLDRDLYALSAAGFAVMPDFLDSTLINVLLEQFQIYQSEVDAYVESGGELVNATGWPIKSARAAWAISEEVQAVIMDDRLQNIACGYLGEPMLRDCQFLANMPDPRNRERGPDGKVSYHRDKYWLEETIAAEYLWCFLLLDDMTSENGGTIVVPGTHRAREPGYYFLQNDPGEKIDSNDYLVYDRSYFPSSVQIEAKRGTCLLFDPMLIHTQAINVSKAPRRVLNILFHKRGLAGIMNCRAIAENYARVPIRSELLEILSEDADRPSTYGPLR